MEAKKVKLITTDGVEFEVKVGTPSLKRRNLVRELTQQRMKALVEIDDAFPRIVPIDENTPADIVAYSKTPEYMVKATEKNAMIESVCDEYTIKTFRAIADASSASDFKTALGGEWDSEFWSSQNIKALEAGIDFFRDGFSE